MLCAHINAKLRDYGYLKRLRTRFHTRAPFQVELSSPPEKQERGHQHQVSRWGNPNQTRSSNDSFGGGDCDVTTFHSILPTPESPTGPGPRSLEAGAQKGLDWSVPSQGLRPCVTDQSHLGATERAGAGLLRGRGWLRRLRWGEPRALRGSSTCVSRERLGLWS